MRRGAAVALFMLAVICVGCGGSPEQSYQPEFSDQPLIPGDLLLFGVHPLHNPQRLQEVYGPLIDYLNVRLAQATELRLEASRDYESFERKLLAGNFAFALPNPYQSLAASRHGYRIFGKMGDDENFRGIILVRKDSGINTVQDLKGKVVCFPAPTALAAALLPQYFLHTHGLNIETDIEIRYVGSQESSIQNVLLGEAAAGATWPPPWKAFIRERAEVASQIQVKWETDTLPNNGLVVRNDVQNEVAAKVSSALFGLDKDEEGRKILSRMELSHFEPADATTYVPVQQFLERFKSEVRPLGLGME